MNTDWYEMTNNEINAVMERLVLIQAAAKSIMSELGTWDLSAISPEEYSAMRARLRSELGLPFNQKEFDKAADRQIIRLQNAASRGE